MANTKVKAKATVNVNPLMETIKKYHISEVNGKYAISKNEFEEMENDLPEGYTIKVNSKTGETGICHKENGKTVLDMKLTIIETKKATRRGRPTGTTNQNKPQEQKQEQKKEKKVTSNSDVNHKSKGDGYIILYKPSGKKEQKITNMKTCAEIKAWLKTISRKQTEYLKIYDSANRECRKSAWIGA